MTWKKLVKIKGESGKTPIKGVDYFDGKNVDEDIIVKKVLEQIPPTINGKTPVKGIDYFDGKDGESYDPKDIESLREDLARTKKLKGGGTSAMGVAQAFKYIAHTEKPVGLINGTNKEFTVSKNIWWVAGFTISNQQIAELPNFTYVGKTITFVEAIPIEYATRDFEIKFIG